MNYNSSTRLSRRDFLEIGTFIHSELGIKMPETKRQMIESRLRKRLNILDMNTYTEYKNYLFSSEGMKKELSVFIDLVTTNKTDFFREPKHFDYLANKAIPEILSSKKCDDPVNIWSCACSRGDEPYTIAMVLSDLSEKKFNFDFRIKATDISMKVLTTGIKGVYDESTIDPVPYELKKKYILRSKDRSKKLVRIAPSIRKKVSFRQLNLISGEFGFNSKMDIIFCRNVIIYFDRKTTEKLILGLCRHLKKDGFLFMGHSEILEAGKYPLTSVASTVYRRI